MAHLPALNRLSGRLIVAAILAKRSAASNGLNQSSTHVCVWRWLTRGSSDVRFAPEAVIAATSAFDGVPEFNA
jgi:hypothetical protein